MLNANKTMMLLALKRIGISNQNLKKRESSKTESINKYYILGNRLFRSQTNKLAATMKKNERTLT